MSINTSPPSYENVYMCECEYNTKAYVTHAPHYARCDVTYPSVAAAVTLFVTVLAGAVTLRVDVTLRSGVVVGAPVDARLTEAVVTTR